MQILSQGLVKCMAESGDLEAAMEADSGQGKDRSAPFPLLSSFSLIFLAEG